MPLPPGYAAQEPIVVNDPGAVRIDGPHATFLAGGGSVVIWTEGDDPQDRDVRAQLFDSSGARIGDDFPIAANAAGQHAAGVAPLSSGGFVVTWIDSPSYAEQQVRAQFFDATGQKVGEEIQVSATGFPSAGAQVVTLMSGNIAMVWHEIAEPNGGWQGSGIRWAEFEPSGALVDSGGAVGYQGQVPHLAALDHGGFVVSYTTETNRYNMYPSGMSAVIIDQGRLAGTATTDGYSVMPSEQHSVASLEPGGFVLVWASSNNGDYSAPNIVYGQIFAADGSRIGGRFVVTEGENSSWLEPQAVTVAGLGFAVTWHEPGDFGAGDFGVGDSIRVQFFSNEGVRIGDEFSAHDDPAGYQGEPYAASDGLGSVLIGWEDSQPQPGDPYPPADLLARLFSPPATAGTRGDDLFAGTAGADTIRGGAGDDVYLVNHEGDRPLERPGAGIDTVFTSISYALAGNTNLERLETTDSAGTDPLHLTGNLVYNRIVGNDGKNRIDGGLGKDELIGLGGNDTYLVDNQGDRAIEAAGGGIDSVYSSVSYTLAEDQEIEGLMTSVWEATKAINLTGNSLDNTLIGNAGRNRLDGAGGRDVMLGREGDDVYVVDRLSDVVIEYAGQGADIIYAPFSYALNDSQEVESLSTRIWESTDAIDLTGNGLNNQLIGNAGANRLDGRSGADTMTGREGNDTYLVDNVLDRAIEYAGGGIDTIYTSVSYTLAATTDVEGLATIGFEATTALNLTGNGLANNMIGNDGTNRLDGKGGADTMVGRAGNDTYFVDDAGDKAFEAAGGGNDMVYSAASFALTDGQEIEALSTITWELTTAINLTGNGLNNYLIGNAGVNVLDGKAGSDTMQGREGADTYAFTSVLGAGNIDTVIGFSAADDTIALENNGIFAGLSNGALPASAFQTGTAAQDFNDRIIYDQATGRLFFDADGNGAGAQIQFARLDGAPLISAGDFTVI